MSAKLSDKIEHESYKLKEVIHRLGFLVDDLERGFDPSRARRVDGNSLDFTFQRRGIEATQWLLDDALLAADKVFDRLQALAVEAAEHEAAG